MVTGKKTDLDRYLEHLDHPATVHLGILLQATSYTLCFSTIDRDAEMHIYRESLSDSRLNERFSTIGKDFGSVTVYSSSKEVTLVPDGLFDPSRKEEYLTLIFGQGRRKVASTHIENLDLHSIYSLEDEVYQELMGFFPQIKVKHASDPVLTQAWVNQSFSSDHLFRLHVLDQQLFAMVFKGKELRLFNVFDIPDDTDLVYHTLNIIHGMRVDHAQAVIVISGECSDSDSGHKLLKTYCPRLQYLSGPVDSQGIGEFSLTHYRYCES
ncbi:MAG: DUF3822 family protein [Flavobacteriales bacterium]|nr:DUF3822 family protein [Flavobacteriales bacterium]